MLLELVADLAFGLAAAAFGGLAGAVPFGLAASAFPAGLAGAVPFGLAASAFAAGLAGAVTFGLAASAFAAGLAGVFTSASGLAAGTAFDFLGLELEAGCAVCASSVHIEGRFIPFLASDLLSGAIDQAEM